MVLIVIIILAYFWFCTNLAIFKFEDLALIFCFGDLIPHCITICVEHIVHVLYTYTRTRTHYTRTRMEHISHSS